MVVSFLCHRYGSMQENWVMRGEKRMSVENDGMGEKISLYSTLYILMFCLVSLE